MSAWFILVIWVVVIYLLGVWYEMSITNTSGEI